MKILISGSSGLVGAALKSYLLGKGHQVYSLVRRPSENSMHIYWNSTKQQIEDNSLEGLDAIVHLAGESIANNRWNDSVKQKIRDSRVDGTKTLCDALANLKCPPQVLVTASAIGFYGTQVETPVDEDAPKGNGFLADVCAEWEAATKAAKDKGIRVAHSRFGVILSPKGGALKKMLLPFQMGLGGKIGSGKQIMSWVALHDVVRAIDHIIQTKSLVGPVNVVSPRSVTNKEFTKTLGKALSRPTLFPMPAFAAKLAFGEMADELLLSSVDVKPKALLESGFTFEKSDLLAALKYMLRD